MKDASMIAIITVIVVPALVAVVSCYIALALLEVTFLRDKT